MTAVLARASAMQIVCPRCGARPDESCRSVRGPWRGREKSWPHPARVRAAS